MKYAKIYATKFWTIWHAHVTSIDLYYSVKLYYTGTSLLPTNCRRITDPGFFHQTILLTSSISAGLLYLRVITNASRTQLAPTM